MDSFIGEMLPTVFVYPVTWWWLLVPTAVFYIYIQVLAIHVKHASFMSIKLGCLPLRHHIPAPMPSSTEAVPAGSTI